jgi:TRAP-type C4-dicarboxylate transport system substrate-binding protein
MFDLTSRFWSRRFVVMGASLLALLPLSGGLTPARAQSSDEVFHWRGVAGHRVGAQFKKWGWLQEELAKRSNGRIELEVVTLQEVGLTGTEILRVLQSGLVDIAEMTNGYVAGDFPMIEAPELPGLPKSPEQQKALTLAWTENVVAPREDIMGGKVLASFYWNSSFLYTQYPLDSLEDIKGHKVRVFSPSQAKFISELGGEPLNMPMQQVYEALQRKVIDSVVTGPDQVKGLSMWEIAPYMSAIGTPGANGYVVVSTRSLEKLPEDLRQVVLDLGPELQELGWSLGMENDEDGIALAREKGMTLTIPAKAEWTPTFDKLAQDVILPWWIERVGPEGRDAFNQYLAPIAGFEAQ